MRDLNHLKKALATKKISQRKRSSSKTYLPKVERHPLLYFEGDMFSRRDQLGEVRDRLNQQLQIFGLLLRPCHATCDYDYLEFRVTDNNEQQIDFYFKCVELLPTICEQLNIPYYPERPKHGSKVEST